MNRSGAALLRASARIWHTDWLVLRSLQRLVVTDCAARLPAGSRLIDFGCGSQPYRGIFEERGIAYLGADLDGQAELEIGPEGRVAAADGAADAILSIQVLEHVRSLDTYLQECRRLLASDGTLFLSTHGTWLYHPHPEDHRRWTRTGLVLDLEDRGFSVEKIDAIAGPLATTTLLRLTGFAFALRKVPLLGKPMVALLALIMNVRAVIEDAITPEAVRRDNACVYWLRAKLT